MSDIPGEGTGGGRSAPDATAFVPNGVMPMAFSGAQPQSSAAFPNTQHPTNPAAQTPSAPPVSGLASHPDRAAEGSQADISEDAKETAEAARKAADPRLAASRARRGL